MRKIFLIQFVLYLFLVNAAAQERAVVNCPDSWGPGRYTRVSVEVDFGTSGGFARFVQDYPVGFELVPDQVPDGGDFSWSGNQLNLVWIKLPITKKTTFSYYARPEPSLSEQFDLQGRLILISENNVRTTVLTKINHVTITGTGGILPEELKAKEPGLFVTNVTKRQEEQKSSSQVDIEFRVQVTTSKTNDPGEVMKRLRLDPEDGIKVVKSGQIFKYQVGSLPDYKSAKALLQKLVERGISDAFIVAYSGDEQVPVDQAAGIRK